MQDYAKIHFNFCNEQNIVLCNYPVVASDFFNGAATSMVHVINAIKKKVKRRKSKKLQISCRIEVFYLLGSQF